MRKLISFITVIVLISGIATAFVIFNTQDTQDKRIEQLVKQKPEIAAVDELPLMDFTSLQSKNPDIVAWLTLDGTAIDYPITQAKDNEYYLHYDAEKNRNINGSIFLDYRNNFDFSDNNSIVYGHNMDSGQMFADINRFKDESYFNSHTLGRLYTPQKTYNLEIFEVALVRSVGNTYTWSFDSSSSWDLYIDQLKKDAMFLRETDLEWRSKIITLSTCSYEFQNARTVLLAKLVG